MANITQVEVNGTTYDICDATARDSISNLNNRVIWTSPANTSAQEVVTSMGTHRMRSWAAYSSSTYSPTGTSGYYVYHLISTYSDSDAQYKTLLAHNVQTNRLFLYSAKANNWKELNTRVEKGQINNNSSITVNEIAYDWPRIVILIRQSSNIGCIVLLDQWTDNPLIIGNIPTTLSVSKPTQGSTTCIITNNTGVTVSYIII